ncbi:hypothetical protein Unana1_07101 [Umbelopsis nana]
MTEPTSLQELDQVLDPRSGVPRQQTELALQKLLATIGETLTLEQSNKALEKVSLASLFYHADAEDDIGLYAREAINRLLGPIPYEQIVNSEYKAYLVHGLSHFSPDVRKLSLQQVEKCLNNEEATVSMAKSDIFVLVLTTLSFQSPDVAEKASDLIYKVACTGEGSDEFFSQQSISILTAISTINETVKFRVYELLVKVAGSSDKSFERAENEMLLAGLIAEVKSDDVLIKINAIEMFMEMAASHAGYQFLKKAKLLEYLVGLMKNEDGAESSLSVCAAIKFFGRLSSIEGVDASDVDAELGVVDTWKNILSNGQDEVLIVTIATVGLVGSSAKGLKALNDKSLLKEFSTNFRSSAGHIKVGYLQSFSQLFGAHRTQPSEPDVEKITEDLFHSIGGSSGPIEQLISLARQPLEEMRVATFAVLESVATHEWGQRELTKSNKFVDYILNRTTETAHYGKTWKFSIVRALTVTPNAEANIDPMVLRRLAKYVKEGPFYLHREAAVAMEMG